VPRPGWLTAERKRPYVAHRRGPRNGEQARLRQRVLEGLMRGLSYKQIAAEVGLRRMQVEGHINTLYAHYQVKGGRKALAAKLGVVFGKRSGSRAAAEPSTR